MNSLVLQTTWAMKTQTKAYKSMEAYNFVSGWVNTICIRYVDTDSILAENVELLLLPVMIVW